MTAPPSSSSSPSIGALLGSRVGHLAMAVLVVELLAGMQVYLNQTVLPLLATEMGARNTYGLVTAAAQVPAFLTMPLGGAMLTRWRPARLMTALTVLLVVGAVVGALAPTIEVYVLGEILRGLAAGALATVTMGVMVAGLPDAWRRLCLAAGSGMWVVAALVGPVYASGVSASWGWRWALVAYLPVLIAARAVMATQIRDLSLDEETGRDEAVPWLPALAMAAGVALIGAPPTPGSGLASPSAPPWCSGPAHASCRPGPCAWYPAGARASPPCCGCAPSSWPWTSWWPPAPTTSWA